LSVNAALSVAETSAWVLTIEIVSNAVPPAIILLGEKLFEIIGGDRPTVSVSAAVQVPATQDNEEFVFVTLSGGEMTAVFVTWVWACAALDKKKTTQNKANATAWCIRGTNRNRRWGEQNALKKFKEAT
jgi:hypothetical protein